MFAADRWNRRAQSLELHGGGDGGGGDGGGVEMGLAEEERGQTVEGKAREDSRLLTSHFLWLWWLLINVCRRSLESTRSILRAALTKSPLCCSGF